MLFFFFPVRAPLLATLLRSQRLGLGRGGSTACRVSKHHKVDIMSREKENQDRGEDKPLLHRLSYGILSLPPTQSTTCQMGMQIAYRAGRQRCVEQGWSRLLGAV